MAYRERELDELCGVVVENCGSEDWHDHQLLEDFVIELACEPYDQEAPSLRRIRTTICELDRYRIRRGLHELAVTNTAARQLAPMILEAMDLRHRTATIVTHDVKL